MRGYADAANIEIEAKATEKTFRALCNQGRRAAQAARRNCVDFTAP